MRRTVIADESAGSENPLLTKEGWRDRASPIGRCINGRRAGVVAHTESWSVSDHPGFGFASAAPPS